MKVAVIGLGNIGKTVATNLVKGQRPVIIADLEGQKAQELATELGSMAQPMEVGAAIQQADIIVLAVWFATIKEMFSKYSMELSGKIIIDPSNPIAPDEKGGFVKIIGERESSGQILSSLLPLNATLAKALGSLGAGSLSAVAHQQPTSVLFYATDNLGVNAAIEELIRDSGFTPLRIGNLNTSIRMEVFGDLHEFGALGRPVTLAEATEKL